MGNIGRSGLVERVPVMAAFPETPPVAWGALLMTARGSLSAGLEEPPADLEELCAPCGSESKCGANATTCDNAEGRTLQVSNPLFLRPDRSWPPRRSSERRGAMPRFQMVFRDRDIPSPRSEVWDNNDQGEPHINGTPIVDGETYVIRGTKWLVRSDDIGDATRRFVCTPVPEQGL